MTDGADDPATTFELEMVRCTTCGAAIGALCVLSDDEPDVAGTVTNGLWFHQARYLSAHEGRRRVRQGLPRNG